MIRERNPAGQFLPSTRVCSVAGCGRPHCQNDYCQAHFSRVRRHGTPDADRPLRDPNQSLRDRVMEKVAVDPETGCWLWTAAGKDSYGRIQVGERLALAHRVSFELHRGPIPGDKQLDHLCRTPRCVNPDHLEPVSGRENILRGTGPSAVNAAKTHCVHGHEFTPENTYVYRNRRSCRTCHQERARRHRVRRRVAT